MADVRRSAAAPRGPTPCHGRPAAWRPRPARRRRRRPPACGEPAAHPRARPSIGSEPLQKPPQIIQLQLRPRPVARALPDLVEQFPRPLQRLFARNFGVRALQRTAIRRRTAERVAPLVLRVGIAPAGAVALALLRLLPHRLAQLPRPFTQRVHRLDLLVQRLARVVALERFAGAAHRLVGFAQRPLRFGRKAPRQSAAQILEQPPQRLLLLRVAAEPARSPVLPVAHAGLPALAELPPLALALLTLLALLT